MQQMLYSTRPKLIAKAGWAYLIGWWVGGHHSFAKVRHLLALQQHLLELGVPTRHEAHVGVNLEAELFPAPQLLG